MIIPLSQQARGGGVLLDGVRSGALRTKAEKAANIKAKKLFDSYIHDEAFGYSGN